MEHLAGVDLNLLPLLDALLEDPHLTRAGARVGLSQPAASRALGRLRAVLGDPVLERRGSVSVLTARAESLREPVRLALGLVASAFSSRGTFDPARMVRTVRVVSDDYGSLVVLRPLIADLAKSAPGLSLDVLPPSGAKLERLVRGDADFAIAPVQSALPAGVAVLPLGDDGFVSMVARSHPFAKRAPSLDRFAAARHALIAPGGEAGSYVDSALATMGKERRIALKVPHFLVAPFLVASADLVLTLAERVARTFASALPVVLFSPPLPLPRFTTGLYFRERDRADPAIEYVRARAAALRSVSKRPERRRSRT